jgi:hypothetical protein
MKALKGTKIDNPIYCAPLVTFFKDTKLPPKIAFHGNSCKWRQS